MNPIERPSFAPHRVAPTPAQAQAEATLLLLVDDHPTNRIILLKQVNRLGYAAEVAADGLEALDKWRTGRFAMVITDCEMPRMDGYELARQIRAEESRSGSARCFVLAYTAHAVTNEAEKCLAAGMDGSLPKPIDLALLESKLRQWVPIPATAQDVDDARAPVASALPAEDVESPIDHAVLAEVCLGPPAAARSLLVRFQSFNEIDVEALRRAASDLDMPEVTHVSHRMKGAGRMVGATDFARVCERIERAARANEAAGIAPEMILLDHELERLDLYLRSLQHDTTRVAPR